MASSVEELMVKMGLDAKPFERGLTSVKAQVSELGTEKFDSFKKAFTVAAIVEGVRELSKSMVELRRSAEDKGVSTDFLQGFTNATKKFGGSAEDADMAIDKLVLKVGQAREEGGAAAEGFQKFGIALKDSEGFATTTEEILRQIADRYKESGDASERAAIANEFFSKTGRRINNVLELGSKGMDDYIAKQKQLGVIVDSQGVNDLADAYLNVAAAMSKTKGVFATAASWAIDKLQTAASFYGAIAGGATTEEANRIATEQRNESTRQEMQRTRAEASRKEIEESKKAKEELAKLTAMETEFSDEQKVTRLREELSLIQQKVELSDTELEKDKAKIELAKKRNEIREAELAIAEKNIAADEQAAQAAKSRQAGFNKFISAAEAVDEAKAERTRYTLEELSTGNPFGVKDANVRADIFKARELQRILSQAGAARGRGDTETADRLFRDADLRRAQIGSLKTDERFPFKNLEDSMRTAADALEELNSAALPGGEGISVKPKFG